MYHIHTYLSYTLLILSIKRSSLALPFKFAILSRYDCGISVYELFIRLILKRVLNNNTKTLFSLGKFHREIRQK